MVTVERIRTRAEGAPRATGATRGVLVAIVPLAARSLPSTRVDAIAGQPAGEHPICAEPPFPDVPVDAPFCGEIAWFAANDVSTGYDDGTFRPGAPVSRGAMAAYLHRFDDVPTP